MFESVTNEAVREELIGCMRGAVPFCLGPGNWVKAALKC